MILLLLKTAIVIAVVLAFYKLVIERESFFAVNRAYLILGLALTFVLPFVTLPKLIEQQGVFSNLIEPDRPSNEQVHQTTFETTPVKVPEESQTVISEFPEEKIVVTIPETGSQIGLSDWLMYIYLFGVIVLSINLLSQILNLLLKVIRSKDRIKDTDAIIINSTDIKEPCSFFNYIFINPEQYEFEIYEQIIAHEKIHVTKRHSLDLLLSEIAVIVLWFNPLIWLFRKEVEKNLEYQTDHHIVDTNATDKDSYQMNLLKIATFKKPLTITTNYNQSLIKQRILKMNMKKSNPHSYWKYVFTIPLFFAVLIFLNKPSTLLARQNPTETQVTLNELESTTADYEADGSNQAISEEDSDCKTLLDAISADDTELIKTLLQSTDANCIASNPGYEKSIENGHTYQREKAKTPLGAAARTGNVNIAKLLVEKGADVTRSANGDGTPLITAAHYGNLEFLKYMLAQGADLNRSSPNEGNALIAAASSDNFEIVKFLVSKGMDISFYSPNQGNALIAAAGKGNLQTVKFLLEKGADLNFIAPNQGNAIIAASNNGNLETVKYLASKGAEVDRTAPNQGTPLIAAANNGHQKVVAFLIAEGAEVDKISPNQGSALIAAANNGHLDVVTFLVANGANVQKGSSNQGTALNAAANNGHTEVVKFLLDEGAEINMQNDANGSALISAARNGLKDDVAFLIENGADVNGQTDGSGTALIAAAKNGHNETIALLLSKGADINLQNDGSGSALIAAVENRLMNTVKLLLSEGAEINGQTDGSGSALIAASRNGYNDIIELLLAKGADINLQNNGSGFALHVAAEDGRLSTVKLLIEKGADVNLYNNGNGTALAAASRNGHKDVVDYLLSQGAKHIYTN